MTQDSVSIKGTSGGLTITLGTGNWSRLLQTLERQLMQRVAFFKGGRVSLIVGKRLLDVDQIETVGYLLIEHQMTLWAVQSESTETCIAAQKLGLEVKGAVTSDSRFSSADGDQEPLTTTIIRRTIRSGQSVEYPGHIVILGDVNPGAKIAAGGHVIVWGKLRGTVYAGAIAPDEAFVCALELAPMQLIIGDVISRSPAEERSERVMPEMAFVQDEQIVAEAWP